MDWPLGSPWQTIVPFPLGTSTTNLRFVCSTWCVYLVTTKVQLAKQIKKSSEDYKPNNRYILSYWLPAPYQYSALKDLTKAIYLRSGASKNSKKRGRLISRRAIMGLYLRVWTTSVFPDLAWIRLESILDRSRLRGLIGADRGGRLVRTHLNIPTTSKTAWFMNHIHVESPLDFRWMA